MKGANRGPQASSAVLVYVILVVSFQIFLITVAVEAFTDDRETLAWTTAAISVVIAGVAAALLKLLRR